MSDPGTEGGAADRVCAANRPILGRVTEALTRHWRLAAFLALGVAVAAVGFIFSGVVAGAGVLLTVGGGVLLREPRASGPKPRLGLVDAVEIDLWPARTAATFFAQLGEEEAQEPPTVEVGATLGFGRRRPLDREAVLADAVTQARRRAPGNNRAIDSLMAGKMAPLEAPSASDHELFAQQVGEYEEEMRDWLEEVEAYLAARWPILVAKVELSNEAAVDAEEARVVLGFPAGFSALEDPPEVEEQPQAPEFPRRLARWARTMQGAGAYAGSTVPLPISATAVAAPAQQIAVRRAEYNPTGACLEVGYPRIAVRHREIGSPGEPLRLSCAEAGEHRVAWTIHARNMPEPASGTIRISYSEEEVGEPIRSFADLGQLLDDLRLGD